MARFTFKKVLPLILALGMVTSGCFQIRKMSQDSAVLAVGEVGKVVLHLYQADQNAQADPGYTFILVGYEKEDLKLRTVRRFDLWGNYGGPLSKTTDATLEAVLLTSGNCENNGIDASDVTGMTNWRAYRTSAAHNSTAGAYDEPMKIVLKFERVFTNDDDRGDFVIFSGTWNDWLGGANGIPEAGEVVCAGMVFSSFSAP